MAVKVIREDRLDSTEVAQRFRQEVRAVASVADPHVVTVYDYGVDAGRRAFLVMELLDGRPLRSELTHLKKLDAAFTLLVLRGVCSAVEAAHRRQLIHRDLKPENIFIARFGAGHGEGVKVLDFGIAKFLSGCSEEPESGITADTSLGIAVGTPNYMSAEQSCRRSLTVAWQSIADGAPALRQSSSACSNRPFRARTWPKSSTPPPRSRSPETPLEITLINRRPGAAGFRTLP